MKRNKLSMRHLLTPVFIVFLLALFAGGPLEAASPSEAMKRMKERLPVIDEMKELGKIGENAAGYLSARTDLDPEQAGIVEAENNDRRIVYIAVAQRTGQSVEDVGANRAVRIAELAREGVWLQLPNGDWYRKE